MKANRKTMLGVALAVAIVALAGIGYAAAYTGTTTSTGGTITAEYVTVTLAKSTGDGDGSPYTGQTLRIEFDTVNNNGTITYTLNGAKSLVWDVTVTPKNPSTDNFTLAITVPALSIPGAVVTWTYAYTGGTQSATASGGTLSVPAGTGANISGALTLSITPAGSGEAANAALEAGTFTVNSISFIATKA